MTTGSWEIPVTAALGRLQARYGATWMIWYVPTWDGHRNGLTWCAKRLSDGRLLHAYEAWHLAEYIAGADIPAY